MNGPQKKSTVEQLAAMAEDLCAMPVDAPGMAAQNGRWLFSVHRYDDGFHVLWIRFEFGFMPIPQSKRDIGRFFADPLDFINFIMGDPSYRFLMEAMDI